MYASFFKGEELIKTVCSLFPLLLGLVPTHSPNLDALLNLMRDENHLCTIYSIVKLLTHIHSSSGSGYGLRSLSKLDHYFGQGENYWKGTGGLHRPFLCVCIGLPYSLQDPYGLTSTILPSRHSRTTMLHVLDPIKTKHKPCTMNCATSWSATCTTYEVLTQKTSIGSILNI